MERKIEWVGPIRQPIKPRGFLFQIEKAGKVVGHFLGSIHITSQKIINDFNFKIKEAFANSDVLGVEIDVTNEALRSQYEALQSQDCSKDRSSLQNVLDFAKAKVEDLRSFFQEQGIDLPEGELTDEQLSNAQKSYFRKNSVVEGIDFHFIDKAKERGIEIADLESFETHFAEEKIVRDESKTDPETLKNLTDSLEREHHLVKLELEAASSNHTNEETLLKSLEKIRSEEAKKRIGIVLDRIIAPINNFSELYELGHLSPLLQLYNRQSTKAKESLYSRNLEMVLSTQKLIKQGKKVFAIAGAMHFVGEGSMIDHMEKMGYKITQIICEEPAD